MNAENTEHYSHNVTVPSGRRLIPRIAEWSLSQLREVTVHAFPHAHLLVVSITSSELFFLRLHYTDNGYLLKESPRLVKTNNTNKRSASENLLWEVCIFSYFDDARLEVNFFTAKR